MSFLQTLILSYSFVDRIIASGACLIRSTSSLVNFVTLGLFIVLLLSGDAGVFFFALLLVLENNVSSTVEELATFLYLLFELPVLSREEVLLGFE